MKDFDPVKTAIHENVKENQEYKLRSKVRKIRGLKMYSYNPETDTVALVKINSQVAIGVDGEKKVANKVQYDPRLLYIQALNEDNAIRKFAKIIARLLGLT